MSALDPVDFAGDAPVYAQIRDRLLLAIGRGAYGPEAQLPSVRALARALAVNPNTVVRVYRELELEGYTTTHPGKGIFVAPGAPERCRAARAGLVREKLEDAVTTARRAMLTDGELEALWRAARGAGAAADGATEQDRGGARP